MTSRPLFIIEAELMVIFWPMLQFGCFSACASVACSMSAGGPGAERPARGGDDHAHQFLAVAGGERLKQCVVFGIRRQDAGAGFRRALHEEIAGTNQAFLVGERNRRAAVDRGQCRLQSGRTAHRRHHPVGGTRGGLDDGAFAGAAFDARAGQGVLQFAKPRRVGDRSESRAEFLGEFGQRFDIGIRGQRLDRIAVARAAQQIHGAVADRTGGAQHRHGAHVRYRGLVVTQWNCAHNFTKP